MHHSHTWRSTLLAWLPLAITIVLLSGLGYLLAQQSMRMSANDPQIQLAEDYGKLIGQGVPTDNFVTAEPRQDLGSSLMPLMVIYDDSGKAVGSSATIGGKLPEIPSGVLDKAKKSGINTITWQPEKGTRLAAVITRYSGQASGYVVVARSLREVENRAMQLLIQTGIATVLALGLSLLAKWFELKQLSKRLQAESGAK